MNKKYRCELATIYGCGHTIEIPDAIVHVIEHGEKTDDDCDIILEMLKPKMMEEIE